MHRCIIVAVRYSGRNPRQHLVATCSREKHWPSGGDRPSIVFPVLKRCELHHEHHSDYLTSASTGTCAITWLGAVSSKSRHSAHVRRLPCWIAGIWPIPRWSLPSGLCLSQHPQPTSRPPVGNVAPSVAAPPPCKVLDYAPTETRWAETKALPGTRYNERMMNWAIWLLAVGLTLMIADLRRIASLVETQVWQSSAPWIDSVSAVGNCWLERTLSGLPILVGFILFWTSLVTGPKLSGAITSGTSRVASENIDAFENASPASEKLSSTGRLSYAHVVAFGAGVGFFALSFLVLAIIPGKEPEDEIKQVAPVTMPTLTASEQRGRVIYGREECAYRHTQQSDPLRRMCAGSVRRPRLGRPNHRVGSQLPLAEYGCLILANMFWTELIRGTVEVSGVSARLSECKRGWLTGRSCDAPVPQA